MPPLYYSGSENTNLTSGQYCKGKPVTPATCESNGYLMLLFFLDLSVSRSGPKQHLAVSLTNKVGHAKTF